jgi:methionyl-tRNA formyltransferase
MHVVLLCATKRGRQFLDLLPRVLPGAALTVVSFPEEPWEPPFLEDIGRATAAAGGRFFRAKQIGGAQWLPILEAEPIDLLLAVSWRYYVPLTVYQRARRGAFVFHDSLLPKYRGFAPTVWAMVNGEAQTGVSLIDMAEGIDEGDVIEQRSVPIGPDATIAEVMERVTQTYLDIAADFLPALARGQITRQRQDHSGATYCCKRIPSDNKINWSDSTQRVYDLIRATTDPYPGAFSTMNGRLIRIWAADRASNTPVYSGRVPGRIVSVHGDHGVEVLTGDGLLVLTRVQLEGEPPAAAGNVLRHLSTTLGS